MIDLWCAVSFLARCALRIARGRLTRIAMAVLVVLAVVACQQLIGLGDEPELATEDAGATPEYACGIPPPAGPNCRSCLSEECCEEMIDCSEDSVCSEALTCMQLCYELNCIGACLVEADNEALSAFFECNLQRCASACALQDDCLRLAADCCVNVNETVRAGCMSVAQGEDQEFCLETIEVMGDKCDDS